MKKIILEIDSKKIKQLARFFCVFLIIFAWLFSGFPKIWQKPSIPPKIQVAYAFTSGTLNPGTSAGVGVVGGCTNSVNWTNGATAANIADNDSFYISMDDTKNWDADEKTDELRLSNFGFSITGTVTGITVETLGWANAGSANYTTVQLFTSPGTNVGTNKATGALPTTDPNTNYTTWGGTSDTWNAGLTAAQVSSSNFGVALCFTASAANSMINMDHVRITITYTNSAPTLDISTPPVEGATVTAGDPYNITYALTDSDDTVTAAFYYDTDTDMTGGTASTGCGSAPETGGGTCSWDTSGVTAGNYWVYGVTSDGVNPEVKDLSPGQITINESYLYFSTDGSGSFPNLTPGTLIATTSILTVRTNKSTGFNITVQRDDADTAMDLNTDASVNITDKTAWNPATNVCANNDGNAIASTTEPQTLQFRVRYSGTDAENYCANWWGTDDTTANAKFAGFPSAAKQIINRSSSAVATTTSYVLYNLDVPNTQKEGIYSGSITYTATPNP